MDALNYTNTSSYKYLVYVFTSEESRINLTNNKNVKGDSKNAFHSLKCREAIIHYSNTCPNSLKNVNNMLNLSGNTVPIYMDNDDFGCLLKSLYSFSSSYFGTTDHLPSEYFRKNTVYLNAHLNIGNLDTERNNFELNKRKRINCRVIVRNEDEIINDSENNSIEYNKFINWHNENNVALYSIDEELASIFVHKYNLLSSDMGFWYDRCALLFPRHIIRTDQIKDKRIFYFYDGSEYKDNCQNFHKCELYINDLVQHIKTNNRSLGNILL